MGFLDHIDISACKALFRIGKVTAVNDSTRTLDVQIGETVYENVDIHYHCDDDWEEHSHPHSNADLDQMLTAFAVDDIVSVLCDEEVTPIYVIGFSPGYDKKVCKTPFFLPVLTKMTLETVEWGMISRVLWEGNFTELAHKGGTTETDCEGVEVTFQNPTFGWDYTLYINGIEMPGDKWSYDDHYPTTGRPETWKVRAYSDVDLLIVTVEQRTWDEYQLSFPTCGGDYLEGDELPWPTAQSTWKKDQADLEIVVPYPGDVIWSNIHGFVDANGDKEQQHQQSNAKQKGNLSGEECVGIEYVIRGQSLYHHPYEKLAKSENQGVYYYQQRRALVTRDYENYESIGDCEKDIGDDHWETGPYFDSPYPYSIWFKIEGSHLEDLFGEFGFDLVEQEVTVDVSALPVLGLGD